MCNERNIAELNFVLSGLKPFCNLFKQIVWLIRRLLSFHLQSLSVAGIITRLMEAPQIVEKPFAHLPFSFTTTQP